MVIKITISNKAYYTFLTLGLIFLLSVGVYAVAPNPGHSWSEIEIPAGFISWSDIADIPEGFADGIDNTNLNSDYCADGICEGRLKVNGGIQISADDLPCNEANGGLIRRVGADDIQVCVLAGGVYKYDPFTYQWKSLIY